jgi:hypothetical protein
MNGLRKVTLKCVAMSTMRNNNTKMERSETCMWQTPFKYLVVDATGKRKLLWKLKTTNP